MSRERSSDAGDGGRVFGYTMIATGLTAVGMAVYEGKTTFTGGALTAYLVFTAYTAVRPLPRAGRLQGTRRLARHLWRMSFGLFIASGSFLIGQMKFIPEPIRIVPLIVALAVSPLVLLRYWMWRVRLERNLRGLLTAKPVEA